MTTTSLQECQRCGFVTGDAAPSRRDGVPRCPPCERRTDHERRLDGGDTWYRGCIISYGEATYGCDWEQHLGWDHCAATFADARALGGWAAVGVEMPRPRAELEIRVRACDRCGGVTTSLTNYMCAACHFDGWWERCDRIEEESPPPPDEVIDTRYGRP